MAANLEAMQRDVEASINTETFAAAEIQHPVQIVMSGGRGAPRKVIDRAWLEWAIQHRNTSDIARFLGVSRQHVRTHLLRYHIREPGNVPVIAVHDPLDPNRVQYQQVSSVSGPVSGWSDTELDNAITHLRVLYPNAGVIMLQGALKAQQQNVPQERIRQSLRRIDPRNRLFQRLLLQRREYWVPGPNYLWHHDGQHGKFRRCVHFWLQYINCPLGLIRWRIIVHGFIDGYSRLITGLCASNNNRAATVLSVFMEAAGHWGVPSRIRGDHGTENIQVAAYMNFHRGPNRGSYLWGR